MTIRMVADTHAILWYLYDDARLSAAASTLMDSAYQAGDQIAISSITFAEMVYLIEKERIPSAAFGSVVSALERSSATLIEAPFDRVVASAMRRIPRSQVPDFPDRIIAATALHLGVPLVSRDRKIRASLVSTIW